MAKVRIDLVVEGEQRLRRILQGVRTDSKRLTKSVVTEARTQERAWKRHADFRKRTARDIARAEERAMRSTSQAFSRTLKAQERKQMAHKRRMKKLAMAGVAVAGTAAAVGGAAIGMGRRVMSMRSNEELLRAGAERHLALDRLSNRDRSRGKLEKTLASASDASNLDQMELIGGMKLAQSRFASIFDKLMGSFDLMAKSARSAEQPIEQIVSAVGNIATAAPDAKLEEIIGYVTAIGASGKVELGDFSSQYGDLAASYLQSTNARDRRGALDMVQMVQLFASAGASDAETNTLAQRTAAAMARPTIQKKLMKQTGVDVFANEEDRAVGKMRPLLDVFKDIANTGKVKNMVDLTSIFGQEIRSLKGAGSVLHAVKDKKFVNDISSATFEDGLRLIEKDNKSAATGPVGKILGGRKRQLDSFLESGGIHQSGIDEMLDAATSVSDLAANSIVASDAVEKFGTGLLGMLGTFGAVKLGLAGAGGAGGAGAAGAAGGAAAGGGFAAMVAPLAAAAGGAFGGWKLGEWLTEKFPKATKSYSEGTALLDPLAWATGEGSAERVGKWIAGSGNGPQLTERAMRLSKESVQDIGNAVGGAVANNNRSNTSRSGLTGGNR